MGALPREERAEAVIASSIVLIPAATIRELLYAVPELSAGITKLIGFRRRRIERRLKMLMFRSNRERLIQLLVELAEQYGRTDPAGIRIDLKLSHQDLASLIGSTRESVTVILGRMGSAATAATVRMPERRMTAAIEHLT